MCCFRLRSNFKCFANASLVNYLRRMAFAEHGPGISKSRCTGRLVDFQQEQHERFGEKISTRLAISSADETVLSLRAADLDGARVLYAFPRLARMVQKTTVAGMQRRPSYHGLCYRTV